MIIEDLFPIPIAFFKYEGEIDKNFLLSQPQRPNKGNSSSQNNYILNHKELLPLRQFIQKCLHDYFMATINPKNDVYLKITQSWLNWTNPNQYHHKHSHSNSLISGCFYVNADKNKDRIFFYRDGYQQIKLPPVEWNNYNSDSWWFPVGFGDLILFPSYLTHMVEPVEGNETRISLAFNAFPTGFLGDNDALNALRLEK